MRSKAVDWLVSQPEVRQFVWNWMKTNNVIVFDVEQHRWHGTKWES